MNTREKTKGIVLHYLRYGDTDLIVTIYTSSYGRLKFLIRGVRKAKSKKKLSLFAPLNHLQLEVINRHRSSLKYAKDISYAVNYQTIPFDHEKNGIILFLSEVLNKSIKEEHPDPAMYEFISHAITCFDTMEAGKNNFHLYFLINLTQFLGIQPMLHNEQPTSYFDLLNGHMTPQITAHPYYISPPLTSQLVKFANSNIEQLGEIQISNTERRELLDALINFYYIQMEGMGTIKSYDVLKTIFNS